MTSSSAEMQKLLDRQKECEKQTELLQKQVKAFQAHFKIPASPNKVAVLSQAPASSDVPDGKYAIFVSTKHKPAPIGVIAAFLNAKQSLISSGRIKKIKINLVNKDNEIIPRMHTPNKIEICGNYNVTRLLYRISGQEFNDFVQVTAVDSWIGKAIEVNKMNKDEFKKFMSELNEYLSLRSVLVGYELTACDISLWSALKRSDLWSQISATVCPPHKGPINVMRWFTMIDQSECIQSANDYIVKSAEKQCCKQSKKDKKNNKKQKQPNKNDNNKQNQRNTKQKAAASASWDIGIGKEFDGKIVTRFPPEPSGYLHIGHAKAVFINWKVSRQFNGKMIVRLDDTNPTKEKAEFEENILRDLRSLGVEPDMFSHTSDYFDYYIECCTRCIKEGNAYCDQTPPQKMKDERMTRTANKYRTQSIEENLRIWKEEMLKGTKEGQGSCVRMRLDIKSDNGTLRDPTIYRCNVKDPHHKTGLKYKVYPTYDFACPIVDSIEGVTHAFRSKEYNERNEQYKQIWDIVCKGQKNPLDNVIVTKGSDILLPQMYQFSRLDFVRTVLSKRKLSKLIERGVVDGWDDPRLPTVQGIMRRGMQLAALDRFVMDQAMSQVNTEQEWDKIWSYNADILDEASGRYFAVSHDCVQINIHNVSPNSAKTVDLAPAKYEKLKGQTKILEVSNKVFVERYSLKLALEKNKKKGLTKLILMNWGIINMDKVHFDEKDDVLSVDATFEENNRDFKGKTAVNWVADNGLNNLVPVKLVELDYLFNYVQRPSEEDEKKMEIVLEENENGTWLETDAMAESATRLLSKGEVVQFIKLGFFIVDKPYLGREKEPAVLIHIPDGKEKKMSKIWEHLSKVKSGIGSKSSLMAEINRKKKLAKKEKKKNKKKNKGKNKEAK